MCAGSFQRWRLAKANSSDSELWPAASSSIRSGAALVAGRCSVSASADSTEVKMALICLYLCSAFGAMRASLSRKPSTRSSTGTPGLSGASA